MPIVPFSDWTPDLPPTAGGANLIQNAIPHDSASYSPLNAFGVISNALDSECQGSIFGSDADNNTYGFAGDAHKLYTYTASSAPNWVDATRVLTLPVQDALATATVGGTLADDDYFYVVTATDATGETTVSNEETITTTGGGTSTVTVTWAEVPHAMGYKVYRGTVTGAENTFYTVVGGGTVTFTDTGAAGTAGSPPIANTAVVPYSTADDQHWNWVFYGLRLIAVQPNDEIQSYVMGTDTRFSDLSETAPKARYVARVRDNFLMVAFTIDPVSGTVPWRVWWPAIGNPADWPTPGTTAAAQVQSDYRDLIGNGGANMGIVGGLSNADVAVFQRYAVWRGMYIGPPVIFSFTAVEGARGCIAPNSIVQVGPVAYYLSDDGFYSFDGTSSTPIGRDKVDQTFWKEVDRNFLFHVHAQVDYNTKVIYWWYVGPQATGGLINRAVAYNYAFNRWIYRNAGENFETPIQRTITLGYTMEQLDAFGTLDTLSAPLDSVQWQGGSLAIGAFDPSHRMGLFNGATLPATIDTVEAQLNDNGVAYVSRAWPIIDTPNASMSLGYRFRQADMVTWTAFEPMTLTTGSCPLRGTGAWHRGRVTTLSGDAWEHAQGVEFDFRPAGRR